MPTEEMEELCQQVSSLVSVFLCSPIQDLLEQKVLPWQLIALVCF